MPALLVVSHPHPVVAERVARSALLTLLLCVGTSSNAGAVLFGDIADGPAWQAVVSLNGGSCTATFVHPRFAITAAHCMRQCASVNDLGCVTNTVKNIVEGDWLGRQGPVNMSAMRSLPAAVR